MHKKMLYLISYILSKISIYLYKFINILLFFCFISVLIMIVDLVTWEIDIICCFIFLDSCLKYILKPGIERLIATIRQAHFIKIFRKKKTFYRVKLIAYLFKYSRKVSIYIYTYDFTNL